MIQQNKYTPNRDKVMEALRPKSETEKLGWANEAGMDPYKPHFITDYSSVNKHKSIWRSMRRGLVSVSGQSFPQRPFNNRKPTKGRVINERKKLIHKEFKEYARRNRQIEADLGISEVELYQAGV